MTTPPKSAVIKIPDQKVDPQIARRTTPALQRTRIPLQKIWPSWDPELRYRCVRRRPQWNRYLLAGGRAVWLWNAVADVFFLSAHVRDSGNQRAHWARDRSWNIGQYPQNVPAAGGLRHRGYAAGIQYFQFGRRSGRYGRIRSYAIWRPRVDPLAGDGINFHPAANFCALHPLRQLFKISGLVADGLCGDVVSGAHRLAGCIEEPR